MLEVIKKLQMKDNFQFLLLFLKKIIFKENYEFLFFLFKAINHLIFICYTVIFKYFFFYLFLRDRQKL